MRGHDLVLNEGRDVSPTTLLITGFGGVAKKKKNREALR